MTKTWQERVKKEFHNVAGVTAAYMQSEINELRAKLAALESKLEKSELDAWRAWKECDLYMKAHNSLYNAAAGAAPARPTDAEIEALAIEHEAFGFGRVDAKGLTTHGFDPEGLHAFVSALFAGAAPPAKVPEEPRIDING